MSRSSKIFQNTIEKHLIDFKTNTQYLPPISKKKWQYHDVTDNLFPPIRHGFLQYVYDTGMPLHDFVNHVRSSQIFCINTFFHLITKEPDALLEVLSRKIGITLQKIVNYEFEFSADTNILGEWKSDDNRPEEYVTATDLYIEAQSADNKVLGFLVEVKFTEPDFTRCGGYYSNANKGSLKDACLSGVELLADFKKCYLEGVKGRSTLHRKYFDYFTDNDFNPLSFNGECPFRSNNQCLRNQSLLRAMITEKRIDQGYFILAYHDENKDIVNEWNNYNNILNSDTKKELIRIQISEIVNRSKDENYKKYFKDRYKIKP